MIEQRQQRGVIKHLFLMRIFEPQTKTTTSTFLCTCEFGKSFPLAPKVKVLEVFLNSARPPLGLPLAKRCMGAKPISVWGCVAPAG